MDDLAFVRGRIESYADYTNIDGRRLSDEQIRAYLGEALARLNERLQPAGAPSETLLRLLLRCQFADQRVIRAFDDDRTTTRAAEAFLRADRAIAALADRCDTVSEQALTPFLGQVEAALDTRTQVILGATELSPRPSELEA